VCNNGSLVYLYACGIQFHYCYYLLQTAIPVPSPVTGVIEELLVPDGETVVAGTELCKIKITGRSVVKETPYG